MTDVGVTATQPVASIETEEAGPPPRRKPKARAQRIARSTIAVVIVLVVAWFAFDGPLTGLWYHTRQHDLASDFDVARPKVPTGHADAVLQIPTIDLNLTVVQGDSPQLLRGGPGHRPDSAEPGAKGDSVIFGHDKGWGGPFRNLHSVHVGDVIYVENHAKETYEYLVTSVKNVSGSSPTPFALTTGTRLTLVTGRGGRGSSDRTVVTAQVGKGGHPVKAQTEPSPTLSKGPLIFSRTFLSIILRGLLTVGVVLALRRFHRPATVAVIAVPLALATLLAVLLWVDLLFSPLA